jgi:hypothetical protein
MTTWNRACCVDEFEAAARGEQALNSWLTEGARNIAEVSADEVAATLGTLVSESDKATLTGEFAEWPRRPSAIR